MQLICNNKNQMNKIAEKIRESGGRFTKQSENILHTLTYSPLSVSQVSESLKLRGVNVDKVTLYRTLNRFTTLGLVGKTQFKERESMYELVSENRHHHHLICDECGKVEDIPLQENSLINEVKKKSRFLIKSHSLEFYGLCKSCQ